jgi:hypothetical protein
MFRRGQYPRQEQVMFGERNRNESIYWAELEIEEPEITLLNNYVDVMIGNQGFRISVLSRKESWRLYQIMWNFST